MMQREEQRSNLSTIICLPTAIVITNHAGQVVGKYLLQCPVEFLNRSKRQAFIPLLRNSSPWQWETMVPSLWWWQNSKLNKSYGTTIHKEEILWCDNKPLMYVGTNRYSSSRARMNFLSRVPLLPSRRRACCSSNLFSSFRDQKPSSAVKKDCSQHQTR